MPNSRSLSKQRQRARRRGRVRAKIIGTAARPRLSVFRSGRYVYAQLIDDAAGRTLAAVTDRRLLTVKKVAGKTGRAYAAGQQLAERAATKAIGEVCFDRNGYRYRGRVRALAEGARAGGLKF